MSTLLGRYNAHCDNVRDAARVSGRGAFCYTANFVLRFKPDCEKDTFICSVLEL